MQEPLEPPPSPPASQSQVGSVAHSTRWSAIGKGGVQVVRIGVLTLITRMLARPEDPDYAASVLGVIASAMLVRQFLDLLGDFGLGQAVIQRKQLEEGFLSAVLGLNLLIGVSLSLLLLAAAPLATLWFHGQEALVPVLRTLSVAFLINWIGIVHRGILVRELRFDRIAVADLTGALCLGVVGLPLIALGWEVWAVVAGMTASAIVTTWVMISSSPYSARPRWRPSEMRGSVRFVANLLGFNVLNFSTTNFDRVIVGRLGDVAMGQYDWTLRLVMYPVRTISSTLSGVLTAALSRIQDDQALLREKYLRAASGVALISCPMMFGLAVVAGPLVHTLLGKNWNSVVPLLEVLAPVGLIHSLTYTVGSIYLAKGRTDILLRWSLVSLPVVPIALYVGHSHGLFGVAVSLCVAYGLLAGPALLIPFRLIELRLATFLRAMGPYALASLAMAVVTALTRAALEAAGAPNVVVLIVAIAVGALTYAALVWWARLPAVNEYISMLKLPARHPLLRRFAELAPEDSTPT